MLKSTLATYVDITKEVIDKYRLQLSKGSSKTIRDTQAPMLSLRIYPKYATWFYGPTKLRRSFAHFPDMSIEEAREWARRRRGRPILVARVPRPVVVEEIEQPEEEINQPVEEPNTNNDAVVLPPLEFNKLPLYVNINDLTQLIRVVVEDPYFRETIKQLVKEAFKEI